MYGHQLKTAFDLAAILFAEKPIGKVDDIFSQMRIVHEEVRQKSESKAESYKKDDDKQRREIIIELGDFVWTYLPSECHPIESYNKLND